MKLHEIGEHGFLTRLGRRRRMATKDVLVGIGDDCAVVRCGDPRLLLTTDTLIEGVHFRWAWDTPGGLGARAFAVNASDVAAMGGAPRFALLAISAPTGCDAGELDRLVQGFERGAAGVGCALVGGNMTCADVLSLTVTLIGEPAASPILRNGASCGDGLWVTGTLGGAAWARSLLLRGGSRPRPSVLKPFLRPTARLETGQILARRRLATAGIDVSDGLIQDLEHLCRASGVGAEVDAEQIPLAPALRSMPVKQGIDLALSGGEDYELLFAVSPKDERRLRGSSQLIPGVTRIGTIVSGSKVHVVGASKPQRGGFDHFARAVVRNRNSG